MLRQKADARMVAGSGAPDEFAPLLRTQDAALSKNEKTWVLASLSNTLAYRRRRLRCDTCLAPAVLRGGRTFP